MSVGDKDSLEGIMKKVDTFFGNVASGETLMQSFYNDRQKKMGAHSCVCFKVRRHFV